MRRSRTSFHPTVPVLNILDFSKMVSTPRKPQNSFTQHRYKSQRPSLSISPMLPSELFKQVSKDRSSLSP